jgi:peptidyl-prolyl cis-trans isomerase B (cyclophilin B)
MSLQMNRRAFLALSLLAPLSLASCGGSAADTEPTSTTTDDVATSEVQGGLLSAPLDNGYGSGTHHVTIDVEGYGTITLELDADIAPVTVSNFADLVENGFYDGLTFHRIIDGFMIQGGDPLGNGTGGSSRSIIGEFALNGVDNPISHVRGVISMARSSDPNSASSQFFIVHQDSTYLDGQYAAFGMVTEGIEVVDAIATSVPVQDDNGTVAAKDQPRITSMKMVD